MAGKEKASHGAGNGEKDQSIGQKFRRLQEKGGDSGEKKNRYKFGTRYEHTKKVLEPLS